MIKNTQILVRSDLQISFDSASKPLELIPTAIPFDYEHEHRFSEHEHEVASRVLGRCHYLFPLPPPFDPPPLDLDSD
jgi:hypothetical protein